MAGGEQQHVRPVTSVSSRVRLHISEQPSLSSSCQLLEELECDAEDAIFVSDGAGEAIRDECADRKPKLNKKMKKKKFKSLKKGSMSPDIDVMHDELEANLEAADGNILSLDVTYQDSTPNLLIKKKRRLSAPEDEKILRKGVKRPKITSECNYAVYSDSSDKIVAEFKDLRSSDGITEIDLRQASRSKNGGKISITVMPVKRIMLIKPEKYKKKVSVWSKDCIPSPDAWTSQEDAILCAVVHEYSTNWSIASDILYSMPAGGFYRGRYRHPLHCCERFRELFFRYIMCIADSNINETINAHSRVKTLLKVTEDHVEALLNVASDMPDTELLLQKHFTALLSSIWMVKSRSAHAENISVSHKKLHALSGRKHRRPLNLIFSRKNSNVVAAVLREASRTANEKSPTACTDVEVPPEVLSEVTLEFPQDLVESEMSFPATINLLIHGPNASTSAIELSQDNRASLKSFCHTAEHRFRVASNACLEGEDFAWASLAFPTSDVARSRTGLKIIGKHKSADSSKLPKLKVPKVTETDSPSCSKHFTPSHDSPSGSGRCVEASFTFCPDDDDICKTSFDLLPLEALPPEESVVFEDDPGITVHLEDWKSFADISEFG